MITRRTFRPFSPYPDSTEFLGFQREYDNGNSGAAKTIEWSHGNVQKVTLDANATLTFTPPEANRVSNLQLKVHQDISGERILDEIITRSGTFLPADIVSGENTIDVGIDIPTGSRIRFSSSSAVPTGLVEDQIYYAIRNSATVIKPASSYPNAVGGVAVDLTDDGDGTGTVEVLTKWAGGTLPTLSTGSGEVDILNFFYDGSEYYGTLVDNFC